jgi:hypothetical protein
MHFTFASNYIIFSVQVHVIHIVKLCVISDCVIEKFHASPP